MINRNYIRFSQLVVSFALISMTIFLCQINATAQSATFRRTDYPALGNNHIVADLNGDGIPDLDFYMAFNLFRLAGILHGITRDTVIKLARDLGHEVREQTLPREMLYIADEVFLTGTAAGMPSEKVWG